MTATLTFNQDYLSCSQTAPYEIGDYNQSIYEYIDDDLKIEYVYRVQLVEADTDTGADFGDEQGELLITLDGTKSLFTTTEWLTTGRFQDLVEGIIQGLNHGYPVEEIIERR